MDRSNSLSTVAESQQLKSSYPAWLPMNMNPANSQDDTIQYVLLLLKTHANHLQLL